MSRAQLRRRGIADSAIRRALASGRPTRVNRSSEPGLELSGFVWHLDIVDEPRALPTT